MVVSSGSRVLVVIDDAPFAGAVYRAIESAGFRPFLAASASEAHALIERGLDPCVVLFGLTSSEEGRRVVARHGSDPRSAKCVKQSQTAGGGGGKPCCVELIACRAADEAAARRTAHEIWALAALPDRPFTELAQPSHFEAAFEPIGEDLVAQNVVCGPDPEAWVEKICAAEQAGHTHVCIHQIGPDQEGFSCFWERELRARVGGQRVPEQFAGGNR